MNFIAMKHSIESGMNRSAGFYSFFAGLLGMGFIERSIRESLLNRNAKSIEILGAGDGLGLEAIRDHFEKIRLIDLSPEMLKRAKIRLGEPDIEYVHGDEYSIGNGDLIFVPFVFNMYSEQGQMDLLTAISRAMASNQELLILDFNPQQRASFFRGYLWMIYVGFRLLTGIPVGSLKDHHKQARSEFDFLEERNFAKACLSARLYRKKKREEPH